MHNNRHYRKIVNQISECDDIEEAINIVKRYCRRVSNSSTSLKILLFNKHILLYRVDGMYQAWRNT